MESILADYAFLIGKGETASGRPTDVTASSVIFAITDDVAITKASELACTFRKDGESDRAYLVSRSRVIWSTALPDR